MIIQPGLAKIEGFIKITGKGNKQRFVPINIHTQNSIQFFNTSYFNKIKWQRDYVQRIG